MWFCVRAMTLLLITGSPLRDAMTANATSGAEGTSLPSLCTDGRINGLWGQSDDHSITHHIRQLTTWKDVIVTT